MSLDYKQKYLELRAKMLENIDISYRLGYEHGMVEAQIKSTQKQEIGQENLGQENLGQQEPSIEGASQGMDNQGEVSELDESINELEGLVAKGEKPSVISMRNAVNKLTDLRKSQKEKMKRNEPQVISSQKKLVDNILQKWEEEINDENVGSELERIINEKLSE